MASSPAFAPLSPDRSPSLSSALSRSPSRETPSTPTSTPACTKNAPPTPPDSSSRTAPNAMSPSRSNTSPGAVSARSPSTLSATAPQFQSRLPDAPIDIYELAPERADAAAIADVPVSPGARDSTLMYKLREQGSPTPTQDAVLRKAALDALPPPFIPATACTPIQQETVNTGEVATSAAHGAGPLPPNVYINGLPPNFPEEDLLAMTRPFGNVLSVRTFTRHVSDKPSGYGFVLFETLEAAEKCIESLRKYRNLHPSFSKQVHKIPGTAYATAPSAGNTGPADSFKAKMEQLRDTASTNLYMEGLPLSVTEEALRALVTPYRIMSSRFFHTHLSNPPRIIAFVRLETREAAEDIIERLHGRLVRGWNDVGCRISVRFADTAEQRELRRTERHTREDEQSPARLTMARAALLNLKGTQQHSTAPSPILGSSDLGGLQTAVSPNLGLALNNLAFGQLDGPLSPISGRSPLQVQAPFVDVRQKLSLLASAAPALGAFNAQAAHTPGQDLRLSQQLLPDVGTGSLDDQTQLQLALMGLHGLGSSSGEHGYTPVEQLILQAHARQRATALGAKPENGRGRVQDTQPAVGPRLNGLGPNARDINRRLRDCLPQMTEDDFHATASLLAGQQAVLPGFSRDADAGTLVQGRGDAQTAALSLDLERQLSASGPEPRQRNHTLAAQIRAGGGDQGLHTRSSTLPSQYFTLGNQSQATPLAGSSLYDSSSSLGNISGARSQQFRTILPNNLRTPLSPSSTDNAARHPSASNLSTNPQTNTHMLFTSKSNINLPSSGSRSTQNAATTKSNANPIATSATAAATLPTRANRAKNAGATSVQTVGYASSVRESGHQLGGDADDEGSPVASPALTYSTRTPASLSPATPYSGFFSDGGEGFKGSALCVDGGADSTRMSKNTGGTHHEGASHGLTQ